MLDAEPDQFRRDWFSKPANSLLSLMRRRRVSVERVANTLNGGIETLRGLVRGTQAIDDSLARSLAATVGGAPSFWLKRQANYEQALKQVLEAALGEREEWLELVPAPPGPKSRGRLSDAQKATEVRNRLVFYGVSSLRAWRSRYGQVRDATRFRTSQAFSSKDGAVSLWLRQGELEAALTNTAPWEPVQLHAVLNDILKLSKMHRPDRFLPKLKAIGAEAGVAIVVIRAPTGCRASGASRLISPDRAMILLSFRHLSDDHFWFTLLHEFGHLLLHGAKSFVDADDTYVDDLEREANEFASSQIVPSERWKDFADLRYDTKSVLRFSMSLGNRSRPDCRAVAAPRSNTSGPPQLSQTALDMGGGRGRAG